MANISKCSVCEETSRDDYGLWLQHLASKKHLYNSFHKYGRLLTKRFPLEKDMFVIANLPKGKPNPRWLNKFILWLSDFGFVSDVTYVQNYGFCVATVQAPAIKQESQSLQRRDNLERQTDCMGESIHVYRKINMTQKDWDKVYQDAPVKSGKSRQDNGIPFPSTTSTTRLSKDASCPDDPQKVVLEETPLLREVCGSLRLTRFNRPFGRLAKIELKWIRSDYELSSQIKAKENGMESCDASSTHDSKEIKGHTKTSEVRFEKEGEGQASRDKTAGIVVLEKNVKQFSSSNKCWDKMTGTGIGMDVLETDCIQEKQVYYEEGSASFDQQAKMEGNQFGECIGELLNHPLNNGVDTSDGLRLKGRTESVQEHGFQSGEGGLERKQCGPFNELKVSSINLDSDDD